MIKSDNPDERVVDLKYISTFEQEEGTYKTLTIIFFTPKRQPTQPQQPQREVKY